MPQSAPEPLGERFRTDQWTREARPSRQVRRELRGDATEGLRTQTRAPEVGMEVCHNFRALISVQVTCYGIVHLKPVSLYSPVSLQ